MVELLFLYTLSRGMRDGFYLPSLGQTAGICYETETVRYICLPIYGNTVWKTSQALKNEYLCSNSERCVLNTVISIAWFHLPVRPIYFSFCDHLFQFFNCQANLDGFIGCLVIDVKKFFLYHNL